MLRQGLAIWAAGAAIVAAATSFASSASTTVPTRNSSQGIFLGATIKRSPGPRIFVTNAVPIAMSVEQFDANANGDVKPLAEIAGGNTALNVPEGIALFNGRIIVSNVHERRGYDSNQRITEYLTSQTGNVPPTLKLECSYITSAEGIDFDSAGNLYAGISDLNSIVTLRAPANSCNVAHAVIQGAHTMLNEPLGLHIGPTGKIYAANASGNSITVYSAHSSGNVAPIQMIAGPTTNLNDPRRVTVDAAGNIYVANLDSDAVTVYAQGANGNAAPMRTIQGGRTGILGPLGVAVDASGRVYVANCSGYSITVYAAGANGNVAPVQTIAGYNNTQLACPSGIVVR